MDDRDYLRGGRKVILIINPGDHSDKCVFIRPNVGRSSRTKNSIRALISEHKITFIGARQAMEIWEEEFQLADCNSQENYQFSWLVN